MKLHSAGPLWECARGKERTQQPKVISQELKLVLYFLPGEFRYPFLSCPCLSELKKLPGVEIQNTCPSSPPSPHGAARLTSSLSPSAHWEAGRPRQLGDPSDSCLSLLSPPPRVLDSAHPDSESRPEGAQPSSRQSLYSL